MWKFEKNLTLNLTEQPGYQIDLERCNSSAQILDWIIQVSKKTWAGNEIVGSLVKHLDRCLHIQGNICSCGSDQNFNARKWLLSKQGREHRYLTEEVLRRYLRKYAKGCGVVSMKDIMAATRDALKDMPQ